VPMLAKVVDAVVGVDTHRDTHEVEIAGSNGVPIARCSIRNDSTGYAQLLAWIVDHAPGPRLVASIEGSRSYGIGLSRALSSAGVPVVEAEQPPRSVRRGRASPTPSTRTWPCSRRCASTPPGCRHHGSTETAKRCGSCSAPATT
jgi:Transposase